jgi:hypothetical protein
LTALSNNEIRKDGQNETSPCESSGKLEVETTRAWHLATKCVVIAPDQRWTGALHCRGDHHVSAISTVTIDAVAIITIGNVSTGTVTSLVVLIIIAILISGGLHKLTQQNAMTEEEVYKREGMKKR